jgi:hypothetical protein
MKGQQETETTANTISAYQEAKWELDQMYRRKDRNIRYTFLQDFQA